MIKNKNIITYIMILAMLLVGVYCIALAQSLYNNKEIIYSYTIKKSDNYEVLLKPNNFYTSETIPSGSYYASKSIEAFMLDYKYEFYANKDTNIEYEYDITANLIGSVKNTDNQDKVIWNRQYNLINKTENEQIYGNKFDINEKINIDYKYYSDLVSSYEKEYEITIDAILKIYLNVHYNINLSEFNEDMQKVDDCIELDIPITDTITYLEENYENENTVDIFSTSQNIITKENIMIAIGIFCIIGATALSIIVIIKNRKKDAETIYKNRLNKILKYYRDLIITVTNKPNFDNLKMLEISKLEDLIDVAEQNQSNIIHYEVTKNKENHLYVIINDYVYVYIMTIEK